MQTNLLHGLPDSFSIVISFLFLVLLFANYLILVHMHLFQILTLPLISVRCDFLFAIKNSRSGPLLALPSMLGPRITSSGSKRDKEFPYPQRDNPNQHYAAQNNVSLFCCHCNTQCTTGQYGLLPSAYITSCILFLILIINVLSTKKAE